MICLVCRQAELADSVASVTLERGEIKLVVNRVPARVCPDCGEAYVSEDVAVTMLQSAERMSETGAQAEVREYEALGD